MMVSSPCFVESHCDFEVLKFWDAPFSLGCSCFGFDEPGTQLGRIHKGFTVREKRGKPSGLVAREFGKCW